MDKSPITIETYLYYLNRIPERLLRKPKELNKWLYESGIKPSVINQFIMSIRIYYKFMDKEEWNIKLKRSGWKADEKTLYLTVRQAERYLEACETELEKTIVPLFLSTGIRESAALEIKPEDIDPDKHRLEIKANYRGNKMKKTYFCHLPENILKLLDGYVERNKIQKDQPIFQFKSHNTGKLNKYQADALAHVIQDLVGNRAKLHWVTPHVLRHTFGTYYYYHPEKGGLDILKTRNALGQGTSKATERYIHLLENGAEQSVEYFNLVEGYDG